MIGAFAAGLAACVGTILWINNRFFIPATTVELRGENTDYRQLENFSIIDFTTIEGGRYFYGGDRQRYNISNFPVSVEIVEKDSITHPSVMTYPELDPIVDMFVENDTLHITYSAGNMPTVDGEFIYYVNTIDVPVTVTVPRGMLKDVKGNKFARFIREED